MSYLEHNIKRTPYGIVKFLHLNWAVLILISAISFVGLLMLYSVAGGSTAPWAEPQLKRFVAGMCMLLFIAMTPIWFWKNVSGFIYFTSIALLIGVDFFGTTGMGAQRWLDLGFIRLQPSELTKITTVLFLAAYYDWLDITKVSKPIWV